MSRWLRRRRLLLLSTLLVLLSAIGPATGARAGANANWFGWGVHVDFQNSTWKILYITYIGSNTPSPHVLTQEIKDISAQCSKQGNGSLSYPTPGSAYFDGKVYLQCALPSLRDDLKRLGYTPPSGDQPFCTCALGGGPLWVDAQVRQLPTSGTVPLLDATDRGVRMSLLLNGTQARTRMEVTRPTSSGGFLTATSPDWTVNSAGNRTLVGMYGAAVIAVADYFGWLNYLTDPNWRPYFQTNVSGGRVGFWTEPPTTRSVSTNSGPYQIGMNSGTLYVGYSPSSGQYFKGELDEGGIEPGCSGA